MAFGEKEGFEVRDIDKQKIRRARLFPGLNTKDIWHIVIKIPSIACEYHRNIVTTRDLVLLENREYILKSRCAGLVVLDQSFLVYLW